MQLKSKSSSMLVKGIQKVFSDNLLLAKKNSTQKDFLELQEEIAYYKAREAQLIRQNLKNRELILKLKTQLKLKLCSSESGLQTTLKEIENTQQEILKTVNSYKQEYLELRKSICQEYSQLYNERLQEIEKECKAKFQRKTSPDKAELKSKYHELKAWIPQLENYNSAVLSKNSELKKQVLELKLQNKTLAGQLKQYNWSKASEVHSTAYSERSNNCSIPSSPKGVSLYVEDLTTNPRKKSRNAPLYLFKRRKLY